MKCDCIESLERDLKVKAKENDKFKDGGEINVSALNMTFLFNGAPDSYVPYQEFEVTQDYITKTGKERTRKEKLNILFSYCPYCGRKLERNKNE